MIPPEQSQQQEHHSELQSDSTSQNSLRRAILPSSITIPSSSSSRVTVNLPTPMSSSNSTNSSSHRRNLSLSQANSRSIPIAAVTAGRLAGLSTPPLSASGANRLPLIGRRTNSHPSSSSSSNRNTSGLKDRLDGDSEMGNGGKKGKGTRIDDDEDGEEDDHVIWGNGGRGEGFPIPKYLKRGMWGNEFNSGLKFVTGRRSLAVGIVKESLGPTGKSGSKRRMEEDGLGSGLGEDKRRSVRLPTHWSWDDRCTLAELTSDGLGVAFAGSAKYGDRDAAAVRSNYPIPSSSVSSSLPTLPLYYYEITILDRGESGYISIGLSHSNVSLARLPGWENNSWGYHGDDGRKFCCLGTGERFSETFGTGDTVGCGVDWMEVKGKEKEKEGREEGEGDAEGGRKKKKGARCFFTKNGEFLGYAFDNLHGTLYPSVGLRTPGENVRANFGQEPFRFDVDAFVRDRQHSLLNTISTFPTPSSLLLPSSSSPSSYDATESTESESRTNSLKLIESYLLHHGYGGTAAALIRQLNEEKKEKDLGFVTTSTSASEGEAMDIDAQEETDDHARLSTNDDNDDDTSDQSRRHQIRSAYLSGDISSVLQLVTTYYPKVLEEEFYSISASSGEEPTGEYAPGGEGGMLFKLRLREFVEAVIRVREEEELVEALGRKRGKGKGKAVVGSSTSTSIIENENDTTTTNGAGSNSLDDLLALGRELSSTYSTHPSKKVQDDLKWTFSLMAYLKPEEVEGKIGWLLESERRVEGADELNKAILVSQSLPPIPHLESIYRHAEATVRFAAECGSGNAALVDVREVVLGGMGVGVALE